MGLSWLSKCAHEPAGTGLWLQGLPQTDRQTVNTAEGSTGKPRCDPPSFFIPARKHFLSRQYRHWFLLSLSTTHCLLNLGRNRCEEQQDRACYRSEVTGQGRAPGSTIHLEQIS